MSGSKFLLDTNIITAWIKGEKNIADKVEKANAVYIPIIVLGELYYGASYSTHFQKNIGVIKKLTIATNCFCLTSLLRLNMEK